MGQEFFEYFDRYRPTVNRLLKDSYSYKFFNSFYTHDEGLSVVKTEKIHKVLHERRHKVLSS